MRPRDFRIKLVDKLPSPPSTYPRTLLSVTSSHRLRERGVIGERVWIWIRIDKVLQLQDLILFLYSNVNYFLANSIFFQKETVKRTSKADEYSKMVGFFTSAVAAG